MMVTPSKRIPLTVKKALEQEFNADPNVSHNLLCKKYNVSTTTVRNIRDQMSDTKLIELWNAAFPPKRTEHDHL